MADFENPSRKLKRKRRRLWQRIVMALAMIVVFVTTYMLILPAITLTVATCGLEEHTHSEECYETVYYDGEGNQITAEEAMEIIAAEAEEILSGSAVEADSSSVTSERVLICGLEEHTHTEECYESSGDEETSDGGSSSEEEDETSGSALGTDTSEGEETEEAEGSSLTDETVSGSTLTINLVSLLNISLSNGNETDDPVVTITMSDTGAADDYGAYIFTNETTAVTLDDNQTIIEYQPYYTFNGSAYILEAEINSGYSGKNDILDYVNDYYGGYYSGLYAFTDIYFKKVTAAAYTSAGVEITAGGTETPAYYIYEETGETALLSELLGSEEELEIKVECALTDTSGVSETEMWMSLVSEDEEGDFHRGDLTEVKILSDYDGSKTGTAGTVYGTEYSVFSSVTDAYDSTVCYIMAKIYGGYINDFSIYANSTDEADGKASIVDGTSYFDNEDTESETCTAANGGAYVSGDDTGDSNGVVRTFDTIKYEPRIYFGARGTSRSVSTDGENLVITAEIYKSLAEARFDINVSGVTSNMTWLNYAEDYYIEYLYIPKDSSGNAYKNAYGEPIECLLMYEDSSGNKYRSRSDAASGTNTVSVNDLIYGSGGSSGTLSYDSAGDALVYTDSGAYDESNAYKYDVSDTTIFDEEIQAEIEALLINGSIDVNDIGVNCQRLVASIPLQDIPTDSSGKIETITGEGQSQVPLPVGVYVMACKNGDTFRPKLSAYFYNNPDNLSNYNVTEKETGDGYEILSVNTADTSAVNSKTVGTSNDGNTDKPNEVVTVSAKASYNIQLGRNESLSYLSTFDLSTGQEATSASSSKNTLYGRMLGYGVTLQLLGDDTDGTTGKGLKGLELPVGETTLNLNLALSGTVNGTDLSSLEYSEYNSNAASGINASSADLAASYSAEGETETAEVSDNTESEEGVSVQTSSVVMAVLLAGGVDEGLTEAVSEVLGVDSGIFAIMASEADLANSSGSVGDYVSLSESSTEYTTEDTGGNLISVLEGTKAWTFTAGSETGEQGLGLCLTSENTAEGIIGAAVGSYYPAVGSSDNLRMYTGSQILIPVSDSEASGTLTITTSQTTSDRYYYLVKDGSVDTSKGFPSSGTQSCDFDSEYLTYNSSTGLYYLTMQSAADCKGISNITVSYTVTTAFITQAYVYFPGSEGDYTVNSEELSLISYAYGGATTSSNESSTGTTGIAYNGKTIFTLGSTVKMQNVGSSVTNSLDGVGSYTTSLYTASSNRTIEVEIPDDAVDATLNVWLFTNGTRYAYLDGYSTSYDGSISSNSNCVLTYSGLSAGATYTFQCSSSSSYYSAGTYRLYGISLTTTSPESSASEEESDYQMTPILWDYRSNSNATSQTTQTVGDTTYTDGYGNWERNIDWDDANNRTNHARNVGPYNSSASNFMLDDTKTGGAADAKECFYGGKWYVSEDKKITSAEDMDYNDFTSSYSVTVSLYTFDFDTYKTTWPSVTSGTYPFLTHRFPINNGGSSTTVEEYANYLFCYSAGYFQVLVPLPENVNASTTSLTLTASVSDGTVTSLTNAAANAGGSSESTAASEKETAETVDISTAINTLKYNSFMNRIDASNGGYYDSDGYLRDSEGNLIDIDITSSQEMFMGTKWSTYGSDHDASAVAGETIDLWGAVISVTGTDHILTAANLLQIFDSAAFEVAGEPEAGYAAKKTVYGDTYDMLGEEGKINFLYVGDTAYANGYNSTDDSTFEYMKSVREDTSTLRFYTSLDALESDGLTCVGIYMEIRNAYIKQGNYAAFRLPVTVKATDENGDSTLNNVYCTMNQSRVWTYISGFPQEHQPMYYDSSAYETSRYAIAENNGGVYYNSKGGYDDSEFYSSSWFTTSSGEDNSSVSYLSPKSTSYTDDEGDEHTGYYLVQNENTVTDSGNYGYYKTVYADSYTDDEAGTALYYHNTKDDYSRTSSAYTRGMSLLITGYESTLNISSTSSYWSKSNGDSPEFVLSGIMAYNSSGTAYSSTDTTNLKITVDIGDNLTLGADSANITIGTTTISPIVDNGDGTYTYKETTYSSLSEIFTETDYKTNTKAYTFSSYSVYLYALISSDGSTLTLYIFNMPFDVELSNISFNTEITTTATSASSTLTATISGKDDLRDYNTSYGTSEANETAVSVDLTSVSSTGYVKYAGENNKLSDIVELNADSMTYKISYTNGETTDIESFSIFDIFPYNGDENGTAMSQISDGYDAWLTLKSLSLTVSGSKASPDVTYYYTTASPQTSGGDVENLLTYYGDSDNYDYLKTVFVSGNSYSSYTAGVLDNTTGINGIVTASDAVSGVSGLSAENITGICVNIEGGSSDPAIPAGSTIELTLTFEGTIHSAEVQSRDSYGYTEYGSEADTETAAGDKFINSAYIKTNKVNSTSRFNLTNNASLGVLSREISGRAFVDNDHSGTYNSGDILLANAGVDLYKWDGTAYTQVTTKNLLIETADYTDYFSTVTGSDGSYRFYGLPDGYYIVAFKDTQTVTLTKYELAEYQVGSDTTIDSDGILVSAITDTEAMSALSGSYVYAIQPSSGQAYIKLDGSYSNVSETGLVSASNDLGLDRGYSLPESGGWGADTFRLWGAALLAIGAVLLVSKKIFKAA